MLVSERIWALFWDRQIPEGMLKITYQWMGCWQQIRQFGGYDFLGTFHHPTCRLDDSLDLVSRIQRVLHMFCRAKLKLTYQLSDGLRDLMNHLYANLNTSYHVLLQSIS